jgi:hypothetical protein
LRSASQGSKNETSAFQGESCTCDILMILNRLENSTHQLHFSTPQTERPNVPTLILASKVSGYNMQPKTCMHCVPAATRALRLRSVAIIYSHPLTSPLLALILSRPPHALCPGTHTLRSSSDATLLTERMECSSSAPSPWQTWLSWEAAFYNRKLKTFTPQEINLGIRESCKVRHHTCFSTHCF